MSTKELQKLRNAAVMELVKQGVTYRVIAAKFGISFQRVHQIVRGNTPL